MRVASVIANARAAIKSEPHTHPVYFRLQKFFACLAKVSRGRAEIAFMEKDNDPLFESDDPHFQRARALSLSVGAIRRAQGKASPNDFPVGSTEWHIAVEDFANDVLTALMGDTDFADLRFGHANIGK
ncbi:hypothetical protein [Caballeronia humi]|nr:hypothetical protein [Caballeronia humi]